MFTVLWQYSSQMRHYAYQALKLVGLLFWVYVLFSVLPRLCFCAIVAQIFENDAAKTVPAGHLAHIDFGLLQDFESVSCVQNSHAKNNFVFHQNSRSGNDCFDWCIRFLNCTGISIQ